ncbi:unnamed protein product, partial [Owenia fusiformis]
CFCMEGFYGDGLAGGCKECPSGTYKNYTGQGLDGNCTACPDVNHVSSLGSVSIHSCICKRGYIADGELTCTALRCPNLKPPKNGYFVSKTCKNVYNAVCGVKCKPGYDLIGSSVTICQDDGMWSGSPAVCEVKTCKPLKKPKNGELMCDKDDFSFGTTCHIRCIKGYKLIGSKQRRCIGIGMWNGIKAKCREIKCRVLPALKDGNMEPSKCSKQDMPSGSICRMKCDPGYRREGPYTKQCSTSGKWSQETRTECIDESPPVFHCPSDIKVDADEDDNGAMVRWTVPVAIDNSGYLPAMKVVPAVEPP